MVSHAHHDATTVRIFASCLGYVQSEEVRGRPREDRQRGARLDALAHQQDDVYAG